MRLFCSLKRFGRFETVASLDTYQITNYQFYKNSSFLLPDFRRIRERVSKSGILGPIAWVGVIKRFIQFFKIVPPLTGRDWQLTGRDEVSLGAHAQQNRWPRPHAQPLMNQRAEKDVEGEKANWKTIAKTLNLAPENRETSQVNPRNHHAQGTTLIAQVRFLFAQARTDHTLILMVILDDT